MLDDDSQSTRAALLRLTPSGDLLDLAREMRDMGVESLLFCSPTGRIAQVVTDRQIAHLAANPDPVAALAPALPLGGAPALPLGAAVEPPTADDERVDADPVRTGPGIPRQGAPARAGLGAQASRG